MKRHYILLLTALLTQTSPVWAWGGDDDGDRDQKPVQHKQMHIRVELRPDSGREDKSFKAEVPRLQLPIVTLVLHPNPNPHSVTQVNTPTPPAPVKQLAPYSNPLIMDYCAYYQQAAADADLAPFMRAFPSLPIDTADKATTNFGTRLLPQANDDKGNEEPNEHQVQKPALRYFVFKQEKINQDGLEKGEEEQYTRLVLEEVEEADAIQTAIRETAKEKGIPLEVITKINSLEPQ
ncbi:MAG: hypothetical protein K2Y18_02240 [Alphaproteobacteria bacterium]|jgi:hypothetical protein|nr:hypothetical protein [Alphaproteobacteria bacterium]